MKRWAVKGCILGSMVALIGWISPPGVSYPLAPGRAYDVTVVGCQRCVFDLPLAAQGERYLLVVANLSEAIDSRRVTLTNAPRAEVTLTPLTAVANLPFASLEPKIPPAPDRPRLKAAEEESEFWLHVGHGSYENPAAYQRILGRLARTSAHLAVYVDRDDDADADMLASLVRLYEHAVRPTIERHLGRPTDVDGDGRLAILLTSRLDRLAGGRGLGGMVWSDDFNADVKPPFSNHRDVLYLNAGMRVGSHLETLLAHELAHAVTVSGKIAHGSVLFAGEREESWLNEAISHVAENLQGPHWSNLDDRVAAFLDDPSQAPLVAASYTKHDLWRRPAVRGSTYLFLRWCVDRYGVGLLSRLIYSPRRGTANLEAATGATFEALFRRWALDLYLTPGQAGHSGPPHGSVAATPRVDLRGRLGSHQLDGPAHDAWDLAEVSALRCDLAGTSCRHIVVTSRQPGPRRMTIKAEAGARLQVTLMRLSD